MIKMIAAISKNNQIGISGKMPWHLPEDLEYFKKTTLGHPIIMGRKTYDSISRPLPGRMNIVLTKNLSFSKEGVLTCHSLSEALNLCKQLSDPFIIGGGEIYKAFYPFADELYLTLVDKTVNGDTYFPDFNQDFICTFKSSPYVNPSDGTLFNFTVWKRSL